MFTTSSISVQQTHSTAVGITVQQPHWHLYIHGNCSWIARKEAMFTMLCCLASVRHLHSKNLPPKTQIHCYAVAFPGFANRGCSRATHVRNYLAHRNGLRSFTRSNHDRFTAVSIIASYPGPSRRVRWAKGTKKISEFA